MIIIPLALMASESIVIIIIVVNIIIIIIIHLAQGFGCSHAAYILREQLRTNDQGYYGK